MTGIDALVDRWAREGPDPQRTERTCYTRDCEDEPTYSGYCPSCVREREKRRALTYLDTKEGRLDKDWEKYTEVHHPPYNARPDADPTERAKPRPPPAKTRRKGMKFKVGKKK